MDDKARPDDEDAEDDRSPGLALAALVLILVLAAIAWFVWQSLNRSNALQDCVMAGRRNCAPVDGTAR